MPEVITETQRLERVVVAGMGQTCARFRLHAACELVRSILVRMDRGEPREALAADIDAVQAAINLHRLRHYL